MKTRYLPILAILLVLCGCLLQEDPAEYRAEQAEQFQGNILVGAVAPWSAIDVMLWEGISMAVNEINDAGGVLDRKIEILKRDNEGSLEKAIAISQEFGENPEVVAVIGHYHSSIVMPASVAYQYYGILLLCPVDADPHLTNQGFPLVFRTSPDDEDYANKLEEFCQQRDYRRLVSYVGKHEDAREFTEVFATVAHREGFQILDEESFDTLSNTGEFQRVLNRWREHLSFDAIILSGEFPQTGIIIREARRIGFEKPIIGGISLDRNGLLTMLGKKVKGVFLPTDFDPHSEEPEVRDFVKGFRKRHGKTPNALAAHGYDTVHALAYAIRQAKSASPPQMAEALRDATDLKGVTGAIRFHRNGARVVDSVFIKMVDDGEFKYLDAVPNK
jgi:branched-chain amino acid transport system substrate-binding protein